MMKKKLVKIMCTGLVASAIISTSAFAAGRQKYTAYKLPARQGNNYTGTHTKETTKDYITNEVTAVSSTDTVTFWATNKDHDQISGDYNQKSGNRSELKFSQSGYDKTGAQVAMGMENANWKLNTTAFVSGWANFH